MPVFFDTETEEKTAMKFAYSVKEFCSSVGISPRTFYTLQENGNGVPVTRIGRRVLIRHEAAEKWLREHEEHAAA